MDGIQVELLGGTRNSFLPRRREIGRPAVPVAVNIENLRERREWKSIRISRNIGSNPWQFVKFLLVATSPELRSVRAGGRARRLALLWPILISLAGGCLRVDTLTRPY